MRSVLGGGLEDLPGCTTNTSQWPVPSPCRRWRRECRCATCSSPSAARWCRWRSCPSSEHHGSARCAAKRSPAAHPPPPLPVPPAGLPAPLRRLPSRPFPCRLPLRYLDARSDPYLQRLRQVPNSPVAWFRSPLVHVVLATCSEAEDYKRDLRLRLKAMADTESAAPGQPELLFVYVRPSGVDAAAKGPAKVGVG